MPRAPYREPPPYTNTRALPTRGRGPPNLDLTRAPASLWRVTHPRDPVRLLPTLVGGGAAYAAGSKRTDKQPAGQAWQSCEIS